MNFYSFWTSSRAFCCCSKNTVRGSLWLGLEKTLSHQVLVAIGYDGAENEGIFQICVSLMRSEVIQVVVLFIHIVNDLLFIDRPLLARTAPRG